ncbi:MAG: peptidoglycan DD-metalloendopeptidase family protein [Sphingomonadales bacterium]|nr:peptidoglycan DD-metalloendopeptidase family protein [Sphingomonadales bacterium]MDE2568333.1 peptidoglycan DD-metalloendopeptidase family protein [Sphingomonadales bacterium]
MTSRAAFLCLSAALAGVLGWQLSANAAAPYASAADASAALHDAQAALAAAEARGAQYDARAKAANDAVERTRQQTAALGARIQQSQAEIRLAGARIDLLDRQRAALRARLAARQQPVVQLTGALEMMTRRPLVFGLLRGGSLRDTVYLRAVLETMLPEVQRRTAGLRGQIEQARDLRHKTVLAQADLRRSQAGLAGRQAQLAALESSQRIDSRKAQGAALREADRVTALAEQSRDIAGLLGQLGREGELRERLAALPGPVLRPADPAAAAPLTADASPGAAASGRPDWIVPVAGRLVAGFGTPGPGGPAQGITLAPQNGAQVVAPAAGRVAFAGPYRGYGRIVIIEHPGGWTSLVTGIGRIDVATGDSVVQGTPIGIAAPGGGEMTVELRANGQPVNPVG